jgi:mono/diheme cytochrome c family protein
MANGKGKTVFATPDFTDPKWQAARTDSVLVYIITNGVKLTNMPPWKGQIAPAEIDALVKCVVRGFGKRPSSASHTPKKK